MQKNNYLSKIEQCVESCSGSIISVCENHKRFVINNKTKKNIVKIKIDNCVITGSEIRCDYAFVEVDNNIYHLVELKGRDVDHAIKQLENTYKLLIGNLFTRTDIVRRYIICSSTPSASSSNGARILRHKKQGVLLMIKTNVHAIDV